MSITVGRDGRRMSATGYNASGIPVAIAFSAPLGVLTLEGEIARVVVNTNTSEGGIYRICAIQTPPTPAIPGP